MDLKIFEKYNFQEFKEFDPSLIKFDIAVRKMCEANACGQYGKNHMCPPGTSSIDEWKEHIMKFRTGVIVTKKYDLEDKYDFEAMMEGAKDFHESLSMLKQDLKSTDPETRHLVFGAGACAICKRCTYLDNEPCRFPDKVIPPVEGCGIDVTSLCKNAGVKYNNGENTVTYIGMVF